MAPQAPIVNAMLLCEHVHQDRASGKSSLLGVFDELRVSRPAAALDAFAVYLTVTNMRGRYSIDLRWLHGDTEAELARIGETEPLDVSDPLSRVEIAVFGNGLPIPEHGRYVLRLHMNGRHVHDHVMIARESFD